MSERIWRGHGIWNIREKLWELVVTGGPPLEEVVTLPAAHYDALIAARDEAKARVSALLWFVPESVSVGDIRARAVDYKKVKAERDKAVRLLYGCMCYDPRQEHMEACELFLARIDKESGT